MAVSLCKVFCDRCAHQSSPSSASAAASSPLMASNIWRLCAGTAVSPLSEHRICYSSSVRDAGRCAVFAAGGLGSLEDPGVSLRPSTAPRSPWLPSLRRALPRMPAPAQMAVQREAAGSREGRQLSWNLRKRSILLEWDPDFQDTSLSCKVANQESP